MKKLAEFLEIDPQKSKDILCEKLSIKLEEMKEELARSHIMVDYELHSDFMAILSQSDRKMTPFISLFWEQQVRMHKGTPNGYRYHPQIIRFFLSLAIKSPAFYNELRDSGVLVMPSLRTLRDYKNAIRPQVGFHEEIIEELKGNLYFSMFIL